MNPMQSLDYCDIVEKSLEQCLRASVVINYGSVQICGHIYIEGQVYPLKVDRAVSFVFFAVPMAEQYILQLGDSEASITQVLIEQSGYEGEMGWAAMVALRRVARRLIQELRRRDADVQVSEIELQIEQLKQEYEGLEPLRVGWIEKTSQEKILSGGRKKTYTYTTYIKCAPPPSRGKIRRPLKGEEVGEYERRLEYGKALRLLEDKKRELELAAIA